MTAILLIDDDRELTNLLSTYLKNDGFAVSTSGSAKHGLTLLTQHSFDLVIMDIMMHDIDGLTALKQLRSQSSIPVIMLTARSEGFDRIIGLELGADDYVAKPCLPGELSARIRAILRRVSQQQKLTALCFGPLTLRPANRSVTLADAPVNLTGAEFNILLVLMQHAGCTISKAELSEAALGKKLGRFDRFIDVHISNIRQKLGPPPSLQQWIIAVRGKGYQFNKI